MGKTLLIHRFVMVEILLLLICLLLMIGNPPLKIIPAFVAISGLAWLFRERAVMVQFKRDMKGQLMRDPDASFKKKSVMEATEEGFSVTNSGVTARFLWRQVEHLEADDRCIYILSEGMQHYVVPKSAFGSPVEASAFYRFIERNREKALEDNRRSGDGNGA
jgi:hypothetical protein